MLSILISFDHTVYNIHIIFIYEMFHPRFILYVYITYYTTQQNIKYFFL